MNHILNLAQALIITDYSKFYFTPRNISFTTNKVLLHLPIYLLACMDRKHFSISMFDLKKCLGC